MAILPTIKEMSEEVAERVLDEYIYNGKTLREWIEALVQSEKTLEADPCDYAISREEMLKYQYYLHGKMSNEENHKLGQFIKSLPPVTLKQKTGKWIYDKSIENWRCSECKETPKTMGYCGSANFMAEHFKFCNHCGAKMEEKR